MLWVKEHIVFAHVLVDESAELINLHLLNLSLVQRLVELVNNLLHHLCRLVPELTNVVNKPLTELDVSLEVILCLNKPVCCFN